MIGQDMVRIGAGDLDIAVDECARQPGDRVQQAMFGADGDLMGLRGGDIRGHDDLALGLDLVTNPAQPDLADARR
jgi:hypothetical protein